MSARQNLAARRRGMDLAAERLEDIRRIRAMNSLDASPAQLPTADALFLEEFLLAVASHPVHERGALVLTPEQRGTIDRLRKEHGVL